MPSRRYRAYLESPRWQAKRRLALAAAAYRCQECGVKQSRGLHVHHLTYARFENELLSDLQVLCNLCHARKHPRMKGIVIAAERAANSQPKKRKKRKKKKSAVAAKSSVKKVTRLNDELHRIQVRNRERRERAWHLRT